MGLSIGLVWQRDGRYVIDKVGHFLLSDEMTKINMNFVADVCYEAMQRLQESVERERPCGLEQFGDLSTLYPALTLLPEPARSSWSSFDQFYSDAAFAEALPIVFAAHPKRIVDIGGNSGSWALACVEHDAKIQVTLVDLPGQAQAARDRLSDARHKQRISIWPADLLDPRQALPDDGDTIWMSQFLDCFSEEQILGILARVARLLPSHGWLFVLELLADRQEHAAAAYSLNATSLYFTCIANGVSRMYRSADLRRLLSSAGFEIAEQHDGLGLGHTLFRCRKRE